MLEYFDNKFKYTMIKKFKYSIYFFSWFGIRFRRISYERRNQYNRIHIYVKLWYGDMSQSSSCRWCYWQRCRQWVDYNSIKSRRWSSERCFFRYSNQAGRTQGRFRCHGDCWNASISKWEQQHDEQHNSNEWKQ